jgi:primary-amine oxidase
VTQFSPDECFPAGEFANQSRGDEGVEVWTAQDSKIENTDIVLWHSFGIHHLPRPEDHPVQSCVVCGFKLMPLGFFDQNPVIDLPRITHAASCCR